ncbi:MAG: carboxypeptidase regulatory-like domain-containing protein [Thermoplasmatales archaeon]|nr:carboxypeptidase regulatory-like domain-containing protein [Thermoplasmatales archaeon]
MEKEKKLKKEKHFRKKIEGGMKMNRRNIRKIGSLVVVVAILASALPVLAQDTTPPVTTISVEPQLPVWGWYVTNVTVTLTAQDDESGVNATYYRINEGNWITYTAPFTLSTPGKHKIEYYSIDNEGNEEDVNTDYIPIANLTTLQVTPTTANWNETKTIEINNAEGTVYLYAPRETEPRFTAQGPGYVRWSNVLLNISGKWWIVDKVNDNKANAFAIDVKPVELVVNATPDEVNYIKVGKPGCYINIEGTVTMAGQPATQAKIKLIYPDGSNETQNVTSDGRFSFIDRNIGQKGAGKYNVTAYIGDEQYPDAFGYDIVNVKTVAPNISLLVNNAIGGFDIGKVSFEITYPEDGLQLLPGNNYNISVYKGGELYAWRNNTGTSNQTNIVFNIDGKFLNLTSLMWEAGNYILKVDVDVTGDGNWEYVGEKDFSIPSAPAVNIKVLQPLDKIMNVLAPAANKQLLRIQIFGSNMTTYGTPDALNIGANNENVTDRIKIEGDVIYSPPENAYNHLGNGTWEIYVFPTKGNGIIYINVTWPEKGTAKETINISDGGVVTVTPKAIVVDTPTNIEVEVKDRYGNPIANANVSMYYEENLYFLGDAVENATISGDGSPGKGLNGKYNFTITSKHAGKNIIVVVDYIVGVGTQYAYARIESRAAHDLNVTITPSKVLAGENTEFTVNITKGGQAYSDNFEFFILNETELQKLHEGTFTLPSPVHTTSSANSTFKYHIEEAGKYYLYVRTADKKHDNMENEPSFEVTKATVTASPSLLVKNVDKNVTVSFSVTWEEKAFNGTLRIKGINAQNVTWVNDTIEITITNGIGNVSEVNATAIGNITFEFKPSADGSEFAEANGMLRITTPTVEIIEPAEKVAFLAEENLITILVKHPLTNAGLKGLNVRIITPMGAIDVGETDSNGKLLFGIVPLETGKIQIVVEDDDAGSIDVAIGLKIIAPELEKGKEARITVTTRGGKPVANAKVTIDGKTFTTDANGEIKFTPDKEGTITIVAEKDGYYKATKTVEVKAGPKTPGFEMIGIAIAMFAAIFLLRRRK